MERSILFRAFADNPIVLRDLRATMRGTRAFWFQAVYLGLLGVLAVTGYAISTGQNLLGSIAVGDYGPRTFGIVDAQRQLQQFYYFIFLTLAGLITLIAPALTATSVSDERQRQSLDLLITTPLSATEMLVGKLMSSLAFLGLLLALSLPASALCVMLGGATIGDMLRVYALLAVDAVVLAAVGLYFSCACKNSLHAVIWTYVSVIAFVGITFVVGFLVGTNGNTSSVSDIFPMAAVGLLSPFAAVMPAAGRNIVLGPVAIPAAVAMLPAAFLAVRLLLTAAAYRFGTFGGESGHSLRKQVLLTTGIVMLAFDYSIASKGGMLAYYFYTSDSDSVSPDRDSMIIGAMWMFLVGLFALALPFLPGLFVPVRAEDAPPGDAQAARDNGYFSPGAMLLPRHAGALPYFYAWLGVAVICLATGTFAGAGRYDHRTLQAVLAGAVYVAGAGTLAWGLSRLAARFIRAASSARALAFGLFVLFNALPALPLSLIQMNADDKPAIFMAWLGGPFLYEPFRDMGMISILVSGSTALLIGLVVGIVSKPRKA